MVIETIRDKVNRLQQSLAEIFRNDSALAMAARRHFGNQREALIAAGFSPNYPKRKNKRWTDKLVIQGLRKRHARGLSMSSCACRRDEPRLLSAADRRFGGWHKALEAAGIDPPGQKPSKIKKAG